MGDAPDRRDDMTDSNPSEWTLAQFGHHIGLAVSVNLEGKTVGGIFYDGEQWVPGVIVGVGAVGNSLTIKLDTAIGGGEPHGLLKRRSKGEDTVSVDDVGRVRANQSSEDVTGSLSEEISRLVAEGKTREAIARYRADNGATLDEARAFIARL
jgi:hypothetical protein